MTRKIEADLHNFGRSVQKVGRASGTYYQKPRPVYWERLFFGVDSPIAPYFECEGNGRQPRQALFNLETEVLEDFCGNSREVIEASNGEVNRDHFYSFGVLLAYCYVFGIRDLHRHNILRTPTHLQVVDAEVVLVKLLLPNETLLLPFKEIGPELASICLLQAQTPDDLSDDARREIFTGYLDTFDCFERNGEKIRMEFSTRAEEMRRVPIRHILRDTIHYRLWQEVVPEDPFFDAEFAQLSRGDIPYFFKFIGDNSLYTYVNSNGDFSRVEAPAIFQRAIDRDAIAPEFLLDSKRIEENLLPTGLLFLAKKLFKRGQIGTFQLARAEIRLEAGRILVNDGPNSYEADR